MEKIYLILTCAGKGERAKLDKNKLLYKVNGKTILEKTLSVFLESKLIDKIIVTSSKEDFNEIENVCGKFATVVLGGSTRTQSVKNALDKLDGEGIVLIHDGARPFLSLSTINNCISGAREFGSGIACVKSKNTVIKDGDKKEYLGKENIYIVQTPQAFNLKDIKKAYSQIGDESFNDDGEIYDKFISPIHIVEGNIENEKITYKEDLELFNKEKVRFGTGFDCHRLVENRKLILGGVEIPHDKGLLGHSDADVLTHAIMDAILSASAKRDIGYYFPDNDQKYKDANSIKLLEEVIKMIEKEDFKVTFISAVIQAEKPKLSGYIEKIKDSLSKTLKLEKDKIGISATTLEGLGFVGREEGICVSANATVIKN